MSVRSLIGFTGVPPERFTGTFARMQQGGTPGVHLRGEGCAVEIEDARGLLIPGTASLKAEVAAALHEIERKGGTLRDATCAAMSHTLQPLWLVHGAEHVPNMDVELEVQT